MNTNPGVLCSNRKLIQQNRVETLNQNRNPLNLKRLLLLLLLLFVCNSVILSVCLSDCLHDKTKTAETKIAKLDRYSPSRYPSAD